MITSRITIVLGIALLITGCATNEPTTETELPDDTNIIQEEEQMPIEEEEMIDDTEGEEVGYTTYTNPDYSFAIDYPADWQVQEGENSEAFHVYFTETEGGNSVGILPKGGLDYGLPGTEPTVEERQISNRNAQVSRWELPNGTVLIRVTFSDFPTNWNADNRLELTGTETDLLEQMLESFQFTESQAD